MCFQLLELFCDDDLCGISSLTSFHQHFIDHYSNQIAHLDLPQGVGDKRILREAASSLGLGQCTALVKRAIQFGTGVAKNTNILYKTSNRKGSGQAKI
jgi:hypothetical protein